MTQKLFCLLLFVGLLVGCSGFPLEEGEAPLLGGTPLPSLTPSPTVSNAYSSVENIGNAELDFPKITSGDGSACYEGFFVYTISTAEGASVPDPSSSDIEIKQHSGQIVFGQDVGYQLCPGGERVKIKDICSSHVEESLSRDRECILRFGYFSPFLQGEFEVLVNSNDFRAFLYFPQDQYFDPYYYPQPILIMNEGLPAYNYGAVWLDDKLAFDFFFCNQDYLPYLDSVVVTAGGGISHCKWGPDFSLSFFWNNLLVEWVFNLS